MKQGDFCKDQREQVEGEFYIGLDLRTEPVDDRLDRVCCACGESLASDGYCEQCKKHR